MILGVDFTHWQSLVNTEKLRSNGVKFAIVKAGEVLVTKPNQPLYMDGLHDRNIRELKRVGILCGDYYYFHPSAGASKQAAHYTEIYLRNPPNLPPVIDAEDGDGLKPAEVGRQLLAFMAELTRRIGRQPMVYSRNSFLVNQAGDPDWPAGTLLWIARYANKIGDLSAKIKPKVGMWQFSDRLKLPGLPLLDGNYWLRSQVELEQLGKGGSAQPPPIPAPAPEVRSGRVLASALNVRDQPSSQGKVVDTLHRGDVVPILAIVKTYWAEIGSSRYIAIKGTSGTYVELIDAAQVKLGFSPMRKTFERLLEGLYLKQRK